MAAGAGSVLIGGCGESTPGEKPAAGTSYNPIAATAQGGEFKVEGAGKLSRGEAFAFVLPDKSRGLIFADAGGALKALSAQCTHAGCIVQWQNGGVICPCHGSRFEASGKVLSGPATEPLPAFKVRKTGDDALVSKA